MAYRETLSQKFNRKYLVGLVFLIAFIGLIGVIKPRHHVDASNFTYVTVHYDGTTQTVATEAHTIGEVLNRAHIPVSAKDDVEPARDTALLSNDYNVNVYRARPVTVVDGQNSYHILTAAQSPKEIVQAAGVSVYPEDQIAMSRVNDFVSEGTIGLKATVKRATPVILNMYGTATDIRTQATTVGELLHEKHITLQQGDELQPSAATPITSGMTISLLRNGTQLMTVQEDIPFTVKTIKDADRPTTYHQVQTAGQNGKKLVTYQVELENGKETGRKEINSIQQSAPVEQVEVVGTKSVLPAGSHEDWMASAGISASDYGYVNYIIGHEGGWCPVRWQGDRGCTDHGSAPKVVGYGMVQATPGNKMASAGADWLTNPITQLRWATDYAVSRYGSWQGAYNHWMARGSW